MKTIENTIWSGGYFDAVVIILDNLHDWMY